MLINVTIEDVHGRTVLRARQLKVVMDANAHITYTLDRIEYPGHTCPLDSFEP